MPERKIYPGDVLFSYNESVESKPKKKKKDKYVQSVKKKFEQRSQTGIKKYNTTLERQDLDIIQWINHAQEEAMDLTLYLERIKSELKDKFNITS